MQCQICNKTATVHLTEIIDGEKIERHLCEQCAQKEGIAIKTHIPLNELLNNIVDAQQEAEELSELHCHKCGMDWTEFRRNGLLGCPEDYEVFDKPLKQIIKRAHEGATTHIGRIPGYVSAPVSRNIRLRRLRQDLQLAVEKENYEDAARIRDDIEHLG